MKTEIRAYAPADYHSCVAAFKTNVPKYFTVEEIGDFERFLKRLETGNEKAHFYVVVHQQQVIGCGGFGDQHDNGIYSMAWGFIHGDFHKKGLGKQLLLFRLNEIQRLYSTSHIVLDTTQHSYPFFEKHGFTTVKVTPDYYTQGMHRYDMVFTPEAFTTLPPFADS